jgi:hypothetical protein
MQYVYRCTRCDTGWLAKKVEPRGQGWVVHVFLCSRCRYASQPGEPLAVQEGAGALPSSVRAAMVPVARLTGPGVEALRMEELFMLLGLQSDAPGNAAQQPALAPASRAAGVQPLTPEDEGGENRQEGVLGERRPGSATSSRTCGSVAGCSPKWVARAPAH